MEKNQFKNFFKSFARLRTSKNFYFLDSSYAYFRKLTLSESKFKFNQNINYQSF